MTRSRLLAPALCCLLAGPAQARIVDIGIQGVEPFAAGASFGTTGAYERVWGVAKGELDPADPRHRGIVNLDRAPRNARGRVEYRVEWFMLRPLDAAKGNHKLFYEVTNRGRKFAMHWLMDAPAQAVSAVNDPKTVSDAGNALLLRQGWTMVWSGWDPDAPRSNRGMVIQVPVIANVVRTIRDELVSGTRGAARDTFALSYESSTIKSTEARLTSRRLEGAAPIEVPASGWEFVDARTIRLLPTGTKPTPGTLYELSYPATNPKVLGIGFAATRDLVSFLKNETSDEGFIANPAGRGIRSALAFGISQSGRYLRDFVAQGFNQDESRQRVFDGALAHISGVGGVFLNAEFGQPARTNTQHEDHTYPENAFPFSATRTVDPASGRSGALLRGDGFDPKWMEVNTSTEYWQKAASLLHTDPGGQRDVLLPPSARVYLVAGTQHGGRTGLKPDLGPCMNPRNPHSPAPALRALVVALDQWVSEGRVPPASRVPTLAEGTLTSPTQTGFPALPGLARADIVNQVYVPVDWTKPEPATAQPYRPHVPAVDADGNERAGIRLPDIAVPLATYTGWNLYKPPFPEGELCDRDGSWSPFATHRGEREAKADPRPSIAERYGSAEAYVDRVAAAAAALVRERLLLAEDAERYVETARRTSAGWAK